MTTEQADIEEVMVTKYRLKNGKEFNSLKEARRELISKKLRDVFKDYVSYGKLGVDDAVLAIIEHADTVVTLLTSFTKESR